MPIFRYKARDKAGVLVSGEIEADSSEGLKESLFREGMIPLAVRRKGVDISADAIRMYLYRTKDEDLMIFVRQFYTLFKAGVSMDTIFSTMSKQVSSTILRNAIIRIRSDIASGATLAQAFGRHPHIFNELFVAMLAAGEEAGILEDVLKQLSELIQKEFEIRKSVKGATLYPKIIMTVLIGALVFLMTFVVPKFTEFYGRYNAELPLPTMLLISFSHIFRTYWYIILAVVIILALAFRRYISTQRGRFKYDRMRFDIPVFGPLNHKVANARFGHIMSSLYRSGLAMPRCLSVVANVIGNEAFARQVREIRDDIQKGATLSESMSRQSYFPPVVVETTAVGERAGALDDMLATVADHFDLEVAHTIKNLTTLLEPLLLIGIFSMVAFVALAIFLPIWNLSRVVGGV